MTSHPPADNSLCLHLDELVQELARQVPLALHGFEMNAIHKSRVATRRLKAGMDLLKPALAQSRRKPFARATRKLRRRLGPLRDLDVMLEHLDEIRSRKHADAVAWARQHLIDERERIRAKMARPNAADRVLGKLGTWWALRDDVVTAEAKAPALLAESLHLQLDRFVERAERIPQRSTEASAHASAQDPHELRIAGKRLRYTLELAAATGHPLNPILFKRFKKMQDALGLWHDYVVLTERIMELSLENGLHLHDPQMHSTMLDLSRFALSRAQRELERFAELWHDSGHLITTAIREGFALTEAVAAAEPSESQTGPGQGGSDESAAPDVPDQGAAPAA
jgi:CHAD domain-containing protein